MPAIVLRITSTVNGVAPLFALVMVTERVVTLGPPPPALRATVLSPNYDSVVVGEAEKDAWQLLARRLHILEKFYQKLFLLERKIDFKNHCLCAVCLSI